MDNLIKQEFANGIQCINLKKYSTAILHFNKALELHWSDNVNRDDFEESCLFNLAQSYKENGQNIQAINNYKKALSINPKLEKVYMKIAECCFEINTHEYLQLGIDYLRKCTNYFPNSSSVYMNMGIALIKIGNLSEAKKSFENAKRLGNSDADRFIKDWC